MELLTIQLTTFLIMVVVGFVLGLVFHLYQVFISRTGIKKWLPVMDTIFGILTGVLGFVVLLSVNYGDLRFFVIVSILLGFLIYDYTARKLRKN